jgi:hypothetical protein
MDDATSRFYARFTEHDSTEENLRTFGEWLRRYGRPVAHYTDPEIIRAPLLLLVGLALLGARRRNCPKQSIDLGVRTSSEK